MHKNSRGTIPSIRFTLPTANRILLVLVVFLVGLANLFTPQVSYADKCSAAFHWQQKAKKWSGLDLTLVIHGHRDRITSVKISPDGKWLATGSEDRTIKIWDLSNGRERTTLKAHVPPVRALSFSPDKRFLASEAGEGKFIIWDLKHNRISRIVKAPWATSLEYSPNGQMLAVSAYGFIRLWDVRKDNWKSSWENPGSTTAVRFSRNSKNVLVGSLDGFVRLWDISKGKLLHRLWNDEEMISPNWVRCVTFCNNDKWIAAGDPGGDVRIWDASTGKRIGQFRNHKWTVDTLATAENGRYLISGGWDGMIAIRDVLNPRFFLRVRGHASSISTMDYSNQCNRLVTGGGGKAIKIWRPKIKGN